MKRTTVVSIVGTLVLVSTCCFLALAQPPGPPPHGGGFFSGPPGPPPHGPGLLEGPLGPPPGPPPGMIIPDLASAPPDLIEKLKLTDDQLKQLRLAYVEFKDKTRKARNALMGLRDEKETMLISGKIDVAKLAKLDEETVKLASEVMAEHLKMKREQLSKLTPEQVERLPVCLGKGRMPHGPQMTGR
jgi:hypothetical protein